MKREWLRWALLFIACYALYAVCVSMGNNHEVIHAEERRFIEWKLKDAGDLAALPREEKGKIENCFVEIFEDSMREEFYYQIQGKIVNYVKLNMNGITYLVLFSNDLDSFWIMEFTDTENYTFKKAVRCMPTEEVDLTVLRSAMPVNKGKMKIPRRSAGVGAAVLYPDAIDPIVLNLLSHFNRPWDEGVYAVTVGRYKDEMAEDGDVYADFEIYFEMGNRVGYHMIVYNCSKAPENGYKYNSITMVRYRPVDPTQPKPREAWITNRVLRERVKEAAVWEGTFVVGEDGGKLVTGGVK